VKFGIYNISIIRNCLIKYIFIITGLNWYLRACRLLMLCIECFGFPAIVQLFMYYGRPYKAGEERAIVLYMLTLNSIFRIVDARHYSKYTYKHAHIHACM